MVDRAIQLGYADRLDGLFRSAMTNIGERIRILRQAKGLSQQDLADQLGITKGAVMHWETGRTKNIRNVTMLNLVRILGTDQEYLLFGPDREKGRHRKVNPG